MGGRRGEAENGGALGMNGTEGRGRRRWYFRSPVTISELQRPVIFCSIINCQLVNCQSWIT